MASSSADIQFFTKAGRVTLGGSPWRPSCILDSQVFIYLEQQRQRLHFPLSELRRLLDEERFPESVIPWYAAYELTKQHSEPDTSAFVSRVLNLLKQDDEVATYLTDNGERLVGHIKTHFDGTLPPFVTLIKGLYALDKAVQATPSLNQRELAFGQFLVDQQELQNDTIGLGTVLGLHIASRCPIVRGMLKVDKAEREGVDSVALNVAWDFGFLKTLYVTSLPKSNRPRSRALLATADRQLQLLASSCVYQPGAEVHGSTDGTLFCRLAIPMPKDGPRFFALLKPYMSDKLRNRV